MLRSHSAISQIPSIGCHIRNTIDGTSRQHGVKCLNWVERGLNWVRLKSQRASSIEAQRCDEVMKCFPLDVIIMMMPAAEEARCVS